jgi:phosphoglycerate dehydrogenase-like enzyme
MSLLGKTIGILGTGKIGRKTAQIAAGFGMRILAVDQCRVLELEEQYGVRYCDLETVFRESDILSLHLPVLSETRGIINAEHLSIMKDGVIIVNTARGELIDTHALLSALSTGKVAHALLDVLEDEQNYASNQELISHPNVLVTPHIAFYADDSMYRMYIDSFHSIDQFLAHQSLDHAVKLATIVCDLPGVQKKSSV